VHIYIISMKGFMVLKHKMIGNEKYLGDIIQRIRKKNDIEIGYKLNAKSETVHFVRTQNTVTGASILNIPPGVWSVSFGWKMSAECDNGDGSNYNVTSGLSKLPTAFELCRDARLVNMNQDVPYQYVSSFLSQEL
jgi:hypothetical protein